MHRTGNYNQQNDLMELNERLSEFLVTNNVILTFYLFFGIIGNITVIYFYSVRLNSKKDNRFFIPWLAVVDLCACIIASSFALSLNILPVNFRGDVICKLLWFFTESTTLTSGFMLVVIAIQRYLKVCRPFGRQMDFKLKLISMLIVVLLAFVISAPVFKFYGEIRVTNRETNITGFRCGHFLQNDNSLKDGLVVYDFTLITVALVSVICLTIFYGLIGRTAYIQIKKDRARKKSTIKKRKSSRKNKNPVSPEPDNPECWKYPREQSSSIETSDSSDENADDNEPEPPVTSQHSSPPIPTWTEQCKSSRLSTDILKINIPRIRKKHVKNHFTAFRYNYMFMLITLVFVVSYAPTVVLMFRESLDPYFWARLTNEQISGHLILYRMFIINHVVNPFIYGFFDGAFRKEMKNVLCQCCVKANK